MTGLPVSSVDQSHDDIAKSRERPVDAPSLLEEGGREEAILEETQSPLASAWITTEIFSDTQIWHLDVYKTCSRNSAIPRKCPSPELVQIFCRNYMLINYNDHICNMCYKSHLVMIKLVQNSIPVLMKSLNLSLRP